MHDLNEAVAASEADATDAFLKSLPELAPGERFRFACHPEVPCFNACCSDLSLMLTINAGFTPDNWCGLKISRGAIQHHLFTVRLHGKRVGFFSISHQHTKQACDYSPNITLS